VQWMGLICCGMAVSGHVRSLCEEDESTDCDSDTDW